MSGALYQGTHVRGPAYQDLRSGTCVQGSVRRVGSPVQEDLRARTCVTGLVEELLGKETRVTEPVCKDLQMGTWTRNAVHWDLRARICAQSKRTYVWGNLCEKICGHRPMQQDSWGKETCVTKLVGKDLRMGTRTHKAAHGHLRLDESLCTFY